MDVVDDILLTPCSSSRTKTVFTLEPDALALLFPLDENEKEEQEVVINTLLDLWNRRVNDKFRWTFLLEISRILAIHGIPFLDQRKDSWKRHLMRTMFNLKFLPSHNIPRFWSDASCLEHRLRAAFQWYFASDRIKDEQDTVSEERANLFVYELICDARYQLRTAARDENYRAALVTIASLDVFRSRWKDRQDIQPLLYIDYPIISRSALQYIIGAKRDHLVDVPADIVQLATNEIIAYTPKTKSGVMADLIEFLCTALVLGHMQAARSISQLDGKIQNVYKEREYMDIWYGYKLVLGVEEWRRGLVTMSGLSLVADQLTEMLEKLGGSSMLFVESAIRLMVKLGDHEDQITNLILDAAGQESQLAGSLVALLRRLKLEHEVDGVIDQACSAANSRLHESDPLWLEWAEPRMDKPDSYGTRDNILDRCLVAIFSFLDYASNRGNETAWRLLWKVVQLVPPHRSREEWAERRSWWPRFQTTQLAPEVDRLRRQVLIALQQSQEDTK